MAGISENEQMKAGETGIRASQKEVLKRTALAEGALCDKRLGPHKLLGLLGTFAH